MKLTDFVNHYLHLTYDEKNAFNYIKENESTIGTDLDDNIIQFLEKLKNQDRIGQDEFSHFEQNFKKMNQKMQDLLVYVICDISRSVYHTFEKKIEQDVQAIETGVKYNKSIPKLDSPEEQYIGLLNIYHLFSKNISVNEGNTYNTFPGYNFYQREFLTYHIPFALNAVRVVGKLEKKGVYGGVDLTKPFYPLNLEVIKEEKADIKKGFKKSDDYFPIKRITKIAKGDFGDNTFLAVTESKNGAKLLFVRGVDHYSPSAILASKIATLISKDHFSSERLLDNHLVGSRAIDSYAISTADNSIRNARKKRIENDKHVFPGTGIIDETSNFILEGDPNIENFGFSTQDLSNPNCHLSKIDFDHCNFRSYVPVTKENYERDILTKSLWGIYKASAHIPLDQNYSNEKLSTRLKLSMLTTPLFTELVGKAYADKDEQAKINAIKECTHRSEITLELFLEDKNARSFLERNPNLLTEHHAAIVKYIKQHFIEQVQAELIESVTERMIVIQKLIQKKMNAVSKIDLEPVLSEPMITPSQPIENQIKVRQERLNNSKEIIQLKQSLETIDRYAKKRIKSDPEKSSLAYELSGKLNEELNHFINSTGNYKDDNNYNIFEGNFKAILNEEKTFNKLSEHRAYFGNPPIFN